MSRPIRRVPSFNTFSLHLCRFALDGGRAQGEEPRGYLPKRVYFLVLDLLRFAFQKLSDDKPLTSCRVFAGLPAGATEAWQGADAE